MALTIPAHWYRDTEVFHAERREIWAREWVVFGPADLVADAGAYVADELAGYPVFVSRGPDGALRGFHNVCPHRAGPMVWPGTGTAANLVCRYHGWAFGWDGGLLSARDFGEATDFCAEAQHLTPVQVEVWAGLLWVNLDLDAAPLASALGSFAEVPDRHPVAEFRYSHRRTRLMECNWKTYADNYLEGYHIPLLHPALNRELDMRTYRVDVVDNTYCVHSTSTRDGAAAAGTWLFRYPNLAVNLYANGMNVERIVPRGPDHTEIVYDYFAAPGLDAAAMFELSVVTLDEDQAICEAVQRNLDAGVYDRGELSPRHEGGLAWFQQRVAGAVAAAVGTR